MACKKITVDLFTCERCEYAWLARPGKADELPERCAKCKSPYWNSPRKLASGPKKGKGISIRPKAPAPARPKKPARMKALPKQDGPAAPARSAAPVAVLEHRETSRHCRAGAHAGCLNPLVCGCACHRA